MTALHAVLTDGGVSGQRVLIAGGAGAVGHYAIQFARLLGAAQILTTVSNESKETLARDAGATNVINYRAQNVCRAVLEATSGSGVDRVIEVDIAANAALDLDVIRHEGLWVVYGSGAREFSLPFFPLISKNVLVGKVGWRDWRIGGPSVRPCGMVLAKRGLLVARLPQGADALQARPVERAR